MTKTTILEEKCPRCDAFMSLFEWSEHYNYGQERVCSKRCYQWWDYGMKGWRPGWVTTTDKSFIDLTGKVGGAIKKIKSNET